MTITIPEVEASHPQALIETGGQLGQSAARVAGQISDERAILDRLRAGWQGSASDAALGNAEPTLMRLRRLHDTLQQLQSIVQSGGAELTQTQTQIVRAVGELQQQGWQVAPDGTVSVRPGSPLDQYARISPVNAMQLQQLAAANSAQLKTLLAQFDTTDSQVGQRIRNAITGLDMPLDTPKKPGDDSDQPKTPDPHIPAAGTDPKEVKHWWDSLSQEQKNRLIAGHPRELGNLNGIPAYARDKVNQAVMNDDIHRVEDVAKQHGVPPADVVNDPGRYGLSSTDILRYQNGVKTRNGLDYDRSQNSQDPRPVMLWAYDPEAFNGQGKAAIAIGNPDFARNTAVIVPGTGSSVAQGWMSGHDDAINLYDQSLAADPEHHYTSVIAWMGYDAPDGFGDVRVAEPGLARAGGDLLAQDVNGLWVTHNGLTPEHVTVIGHSYGSTTVADAFAHSGMHANDAVLIGCPGTDLAHNAADFHLDGGQVYVGSASTDPVSWIGESDGIAKEWLKQQLWEHGIPIPADAGLGRDPAGDGFGSVRFHAEVPGSEHLSRNDHSHYYVRGSEALRSMTDIASGHPDRLAADGLLAEGRHQPHIGPFRIPGLPAYIDPEGDRAPETVHDDHAY